MKVDRDVIAGGRELELVITTEHDGITIQSGVHRSLHQRRQGGVRFVTRGSLEELAHLAHGMTEKCAAAGVPVDGMKAMVICPDGIPHDYDTRAALLRSHIEQAIAFDAGMVFGPDMGSPEAVLDRIVDEAPHLIQNVTGLSCSHGGLDIDQNGLTAFGMLAGIEHIRPNLANDRVTIQGFGNVGAPLSLLLHQRGAAVVAVSNISGTATDSQGLDIASLYRLWREWGDDCLAIYTERGPATYSADPGTIFEISADIFVPAARTSVLGLTNELQHLCRENPDVQDIEAFLKSSGVSVIAEAANHPLSFAAERFAETQGVTVLPDVIVNCGGMIGCWYEYDHRDELLRNPAAYEQALACCREFIGRRIRENLTLLGRGEGAAIELRGRAISRAHHH